MVRLPPLRQRKAGSFCLVKIIDTNLPLACAVDSVVIEQDCETQLLEDHESAVRSPEDAEVRMLDHAAYLVRDGLDPVSGMDESGHMDAMSLGWVVMMPEGNRPLILQKAGGLQGTFTYIAFAPTRGVAAFVAINKFDFAAAMGMAEAVNEMIATLAPR